MRHSARCTARAAHGPGELEAPATSASACGALGPSAAGEADVRSVCVHGRCCRTVSLEGPVCADRRAFEKHSVSYTACTRHARRPPDCAQLQHLQPLSLSLHATSVSLGHVDNSETAAYVALLFRDQWSSWDTRITSAPHEMRSPRMTGERRAVCRCSRRQHRRESPVRFVHRQHVPVVVMVRVTVGTMLRGRRVVDHSGYSARRRATISSGTVVCAGPKVRIRRFWRLVAPRTEASSGVPASYVKNLCARG